LFPQVEPNTKLFPAVFVLPSNQNVLQVELGKLKVSLPRALFNEIVHPIKSNHNYRYIN